MSKELKLVSPWENFYKEIQIMFEDDIDIDVVILDNVKTVKLYVDSATKADALMTLLPTEKVFGDLTVKIAVIPPNNQTKADVFARAFEGNPIFMDAAEARDFNYIFFRKKVVQYWNDNMGDGHGITSTLYQNIAKDVFGEIPGVFYCTSTEE